MESRKRTIAKTITWRITAILSTFIIALIFTGEMIIAGAIGLVDGIISTILYFIHERAWNKVNFGRE